MIKYLVRLHVYSSFSVEIEGETQTYDGERLHHIIVPNVSVFKDATYVGHARIIGYEAIEVDEAPEEVIAEVVETSDEDVAEVIAEVVVEAIKAKKTPVFTSCPICGTRKSNSKEFCKKCLAKKEEEIKEI